MSGDEIYECATAETDSLAELRNELNQIAQEEFEERHRQNEIDFAEARNAELRRELNEMAAEDAWLEESERQRLEDLAAKSRADAAKEEEEFQQRLSMSVLQSQPLANDRSQDDWRIATDPWNMLPVNIFEDLSQANSCIQYDDSLNDDISRERRVFRTTTEVTEPLTSSSIQPFGDVLGYKTFFNEDGRLVLIVDDAEIRPLNECCAKNMETTCSISRCFGM
jgi:hypothetical protein